MYTKNEQKYDTQYLKIVSQIFISATTKLWCAIKKEKLSEDHQ